MAGSWRASIVVLGVAVLAAGCGSGKPGAPGGAAGSGGGGASFVLPDPDPPKVVYDGRVVVAPAAVLLTTAGETAQLAATATDAAGNPVTGTVTWTSSRPEEIAVSDQGVVTAVAAVGSAQITARIGDRVSDPVPVLAVAAYPDTTFVTDAQIVSGPTPVDDKAPVVPGAHLRATLTGVAAPAVGSLVVAREGKPLAGRVVSVTAEGSDQIVELEVVPLLDLFAKMNIRLSSTIDERALVAIEAAGGPKPVDTDSEYGFAQEALQLSGWECSLSGGGANQAAYGLSIDSSVRIVPSLDLDTAFVKDAEGDWALLSVDLAGSVAATGKLSLKFAAAAQVEGTCTATLHHIHVPIGGPLALVASFAVPVGLVGKVKASIGTAPFEFGVEVRLTGQVHDRFAYTPMTGMTYARDSGVDFRGKALHSFPLTRLPVTVKLDVAAGVFAGLDLRVFVWYHALLRADFLGKFAADLALEDTQLDVADYASKYEVVPAIEIGPGKSVSDALKFFGDRIRLQPRLSLEFPAQGFKSPLGVLTADRSAVHPDDTVEIKLTLDPRTLTFAGLDNVQFVRLYRETAAMERHLVEYQAATPGKSVYTWKWKARKDEIGPAKFWAATETTLGPYVPLEVAPDSKLIVQVQKPTEGGYSYTLDAGTQCSESFAGTTRTYDMRAHCTGTQAQTIKSAKGGLHEVDDGMSTCTYSERSETASVANGCTSRRVVEKAASGTGPGMAVVVWNIKINADTYELAVITGSAEIPMNVVIWEEKTGSCTTPMAKTVVSSSTSTRTSPYWGEMIPDIVKPVDPDHPGVFSGSATIETNPIPHPCGIDVSSAAQVSARSTATIEWDLKR